MPNDFLRSKVQIISVDVCHKVVFGRCIYNRTSTKPCSWINVINKIELLLTLIGVIITAVTAFYWV